MDANELGDLLLDVLPPDRTAMGNRSAWEALGRVAGRDITQAEYEQVRDHGLAIGTIKKRPWPGWRHRPGRRYQGDLIT